jgi:uncharacterized membrane protein|tara:strand:+ start:301 stop:759 length:459 start_codon:yes stop_codon:yes gene_type:complete
MLQDIILTFLISLSPFGEARVGIPFGVESTALPTIWIFIIGLSANLLVFPLFYKVIELSNKFFLKNLYYKKFALYLSARARTKTKKMIKNYGVIGLMIFVMIPLPVTGAYIGTIAAYIFRIDYKKSLIAVSTGIAISSTIVILGWPLITSLF